MASVEMSGLTQTIGVAHKSLAKYDQLLRAFSEATVALVFLPAVLKFVSLFSLLDGSVALVGYESIYGLRVRDFEPQAVLGYNGWLGYQPN